MEHRKSIDNETEEKTLKTLGVMCVTVTDWVALADLTDVTLVSGHDNFHHDMIM